MNEASLNRNAWLGMIGAGLLGHAISFGAGYWVGASRSAPRETAAAVAAHAVYAADTQRGAADTTTYVQRATEQARAYQHLSDHVKNTIASQPLAVARGLAAPAQAQTTPTRTAARSNPAQRAGAPVPAADPAPPGAVECTALVGADAVLTGAAVSLWNSALAGQPLPAGPEGAADPRAAARAADRDPGDAGRSAGQPRGEQPPRGGQPPAARQPDRALARAEVR